MSWEIEFLKHIRTTHFTLMGSLVILLVAMNLARAPQIEAAYHELTVVDTIRNKYFSDNNMRRITTDKNIDFFATSNDYSPTNGMNAFIKKVVNSLVFKDPTLGRLRIGSWKWGMTMHTKGTKRLVTVFTNDPQTFGAFNISQFTKEWNFLDSANAARVQSISLTGMKFFNYKGEIKKPQNVIIDRSGKQDNFVEATLGLKEESNKLITFAQRYWYLVIDLNNSDADLGFDTIYVPINISFLSAMKPQSILVPYNNAAVPVGEFSEAFGDLYDVTRGLDSLSFSDLLPYLRGERNKTTDQITIFGVDIPIQSINTWGLFLVFLFQFYFLNDLIQFCGRRPRPEDILNFAWIGVYPSRASRFAFLASSTVFPAAVSAMSLVLGVRLGSAGLTTGNLLVIASSASVMMSSLLSFLVILRFQKYLALIFSRLGHSAEVVEPRNSTS